MPTGRRLRGDRRLRLRRCRRRGRRPSPFVNHSLPRCLEPIDAFRMYPFLVRVFLFPFPFAFPFLVSPPCLVPCSRRSLSRFPLRVRRCCKGPVAACLGAIAILVTIHVPPLLRCGPEADPSDALGDGELGGSRDVGGAARDAVDDVIHGAAGRRDGLQQPLRARRRTRKRPAPRARGASGGGRWCGRWGGRRRVCARPRGRFSAGVGGGRWGRRGRPFDEAAPGDEEDGRHKVESVGAQNGHARRLHQRRGAATRHQQRTKGRRRRGRGRRGPLSGAGRRLHPPRKPRQRRGNARSARSASDAASDAASASASTRASGPLSAPPFLCSALPRSGRFAVPVREDDLDAVGAVRFFVVGRGPKRLAHVVAHESLEGSRPRQPRLGTPRGRPSASHAPRLLRSLHHVAHVRKRKREQTRATRKMAPRNGKTQRSNLHQLGRSDRKRVLAGRATSIRNTGGGGGGRDRRTRKEGKQVRRTRTREKKGERQHNDGRMKWKNKT